jgi:hypothetical protein
MIRAKHDGTLIGFDVLRNEWVVELSGTDEREPFTGEAVVVVLTVAKLVELLRDVVQHAPAALDEEAEGRLRNSVAKQQRGGGT